MLCQILSGSWVERMNLTTKQPTTICLIVQIRGSTGTSTSTLAPTAASQPARPYPHIRDNPEYKSYRTFTWALIQGGASMREGGHRHGSPHRCATPSRSRCGKHQQARNAGRGGRSCPRERRTPKLEIQPFGLSTPCQTSSVVPPRTDATA
jgi:hypothetical protein